MSNLRKSELQTMLSESVEIASSIDVEKVAKGRHAFHYENGDFRYDYLITENPGDHLFVLLSGANGRGKVPLPIYQRWKWMHRFPGTVLNVADPSLRSDDEITLAWYLGNERQDATYTIVQTVNAIARNRGISNDKIVFWGSSGGGFAALRAGALVLGSLSVSINPQTIVTEYFPRPVSEMLGANFNGMDTDSFSKMHPLRNSTIDMIKTFNPEHRVLFVQNEQDKFHLKEHALPFLQAFKMPEKGGLNPNRKKCYLTFDADTGHGPEPIEMLQDLIHNAVNFETYLSDADTPLSAPKDVPLMSMTDLLMAANQTHIADKKTSHQERARLFRDERAFQPRRDVETVNLPTPIDWAAERKGDSNWSMQLHSLRCLIPLCTEINRKPTQDMLSAGFEIIFEWAEVNLYSTEHFFAWYDMSVGLRSKFIAFFVTQQYALDPSFPDVDRKLLSKIISAHAKHLSDMSLFSLNNHGFFQAHGLAALIRCAPAIGLDLSSKNKLAGAMLRDLIVQQFGQEGMHMEHSPDYHFFAHNIAKKLFATGWYSDFQDLTNISEGIETARHWLRDPLGLTYVIGDSGAGRKVSPPNLKSLGEKAKLVSDRKVVARAFNEAGYAFARTVSNIPSEQAGGFSLFAGHHDYAHKHSDDLAVTYIDQGRRILIDAGKYGYLRDKWRKYVMGTSAHCTVQVDGKSTSRLKENIYGSGIESVAITSDAVTASASVSRKDLGAQHARTVSWKPGEAFVLTDEMKTTNGKSHEYIVWFLFDEELEVRRDEAGGVSIWAEEDKIGELNVDGAALKFLDKGNENDMIGWHSPSYGKVAPCWAAGFAVKAKSVFITSTLKILREDS